MGIGFEGQPVVARPFQQTSVHSLSWHVSSQIARAYLLRLLWNYRKMRGLSEGADRENQ